MMREKGVTSNSRGVDGACYCADAKYLLYSAAIEFLGEPERPFAGCVEGI